MSRIHGLIGFHAVLTACLLICSCSGDVSNCPSPTYPVVKHIGIVTLSLDDRLSDLCSQAGLSDGWSDHIGFFEEHLGSLEDTADIWLVSIDSVSISFEDAMEWCNQNGYQLASVHATVSSMIQRKDRYDSNVQCLLAGPVTMDEDCNPHIAVIYPDDNEFWKEGLIIIRPTTWIVVTKH